MSASFKWLQFFADGASGGDGGDGAGSGATAADAGRTTGETAVDAGQRLADLGVPKDKADKYKGRMEKRYGRREDPSIPAKSASAQDDKEAGKAAQAQGQEKEPVDVDALLKIPEVQQRIQGMMAERGKKATETANAAQAQLGKMAPLLQLLGGRYNIEAKDGQYDLDALIAAATDDDYFFEDRALEQGESTEKVKADWKKERETAQRQQDERRKQLEENFYKMQQQVPDMQKEFPNFDLNTEMQNPEFLRLTAPDIGWNVRRAYRSIHQDEIEKSIVETVAAKARADAARAREAGQARPRENGSSTAAIATKRDYASFKEMFKCMTPEERLRYIKEHPPR